MVQYIQNSSQPSAWGIQAPLQTNWNLTLLETLCISQSHCKVLLYLRYGWSVSHDDTAATTITLQNYSSAKKHQEAVDKYILKEL